MKIHKTHQKLIKNKDDKILKLHKIMKTKQMTKINKQNVYYKSDRLISEIKCMVRGHRYKLQNGGNQKK